MHVLRLSCVPPCLTLYATHAVPSALSEAFLVPFLTFSQFHCRQLRVFPYGFLVGVFPHSPYIQLTSNISPCVPHTFPVRFFPVCFAIRNSAPSPLGYWTFPVLSLWIPRATRALQRAFAECPIMLWYNVGKNGIGQDNLYLTQFFRTLSLSSINLNLRRK